MKCPNCGAEFTSDVCEYCGTHKPMENKTNFGCPHCGSRNYHYSLQRRSWYTQETVCTCQDCGFSWENGPSGAPEINPTIILWIVGWVMCFPIPLSILIYRSKTLPTVAKYILIAAAWLALIAPYLFTVLDIFMF